MAARCHYRSLLERLSSRLRAYYKGKLGRFGRGAVEVEDLVQEVLAALGMAMRYLTKLARPGAERGMSPLAIVMPFAAIALLGAMSLGIAPSSHWNRMVLGDEGLECLLSIPIIAIVPVEVTIFAVRRAAPTDLIRTGAVAGLAAGGVSAMAYTLHGTDDSLPFVAVWYGGTIVLCTLAGAALGPRLLRW